MSWGKGKSCQQGGYKQKNKTKQNKQTTKKKTKHQQKQTKKHQQKTPTKTKEQEHKKTKRIAQYFEGEKYYRTETSEKR